MTDRPGRPAPPVTLRHSSAGPGAGSPPEGPVDRSRARRRPGPRTWLLLVAVAVVVLGAVAVDDRRASREVDQLLVEMEHSRSVLALADRRVAGISSYVRPSLGVSGTPAETTARLRAIISDTSADQAPLVLAAADRVRSVGALPWHTDVRRARDDYVAYLQARAADYAAGGADVGGGAHVGGGAQVGTGADGTERLRGRALLSLQQLLGSARQDEARRLVGASAPPTVDSPAPLHRPLSP